MITFCHNINAGTLWNRVDNQGMTFLQALLWKRGANQGRGMKGMNFGRNCRIRERNTYSRRQSRYYLPLIYLKVKIDFQC